MALSDDEIDLLRHGLRLMQARKQMASAIFYERLFEIAPATRALFSDDILAQTEKVMIALGAVVGQIHDLDACREMTRDLARRHVGYGVEAAHYALVGRVVMQTLSEVIDDAFTSAMETAWRKAYAAIAAAMIASAYGTDARSAA